MKTPQELQSIFDKFPLDKVELEKVQLGVADDLAKLQSKLEKAVANEKEYFQEVKEVNKATKEVVKLIRKQETARNKAMDKGDKLQKQNEEIWSNADDVVMKAAMAAKELGIKPDAIPNYKKADGLLQKVGLIDTESDFESSEYF